MRDSSRPRRERSSSRRDRDDKDRDRRGDREREDYRRDDYRRERDDYPRRDRDPDKDEAEDPRRWRDDGKRDERVAARRDREYREQRNRDRPPRDDAWDANDRHGGRWTVVEDRDSRSKRGAARDRRGGLDDAKEDRRDRDRDREREREKEPAWMDTYIPSPTGGAGTLSLGKGAEGELDGIQAFKKGMKAMEQKDGSSQDDAKDVDSGRAQGTPSPSEKPLDEIQLFKMMMKKEQAPTTPEKPPPPSSNPALMGPTLQDIENGALLRGKEQRRPSPSENGMECSSYSCAKTLTRNPAEHSDAEPKFALDKVIPSQAGLTPTNGDAPQALLSIFSSVSSTNGNGSAPVSTTTPTTPSADSALPKSASSRFFPKPPPSDGPSLTFTDPSPANTQAPPQFNPPAGSRFLALSNRNHPPTPSIGQSSSQPIPSSLQHQQAQHSQQLAQSSSDSLHSDFNHRQAMSEAMRAHQGFSPFDQHTRPGFSSDDHRGPNDAIRRMGSASPAGRGPFSPDTGVNYGGGHNANADSFSVNGSGPPFDPMNNGAQLNQGKGSRFLKYFEEKGREAQQQPGMGRKPSGPIGYQSSSPIPGQRQEAGGFNGGGQMEGRTVDDLFAMLNPSQVRALAHDNDFGSLIPYLVGPAWKWYGTYGTRHGIKH